MSRKVYAIMWNGSLEEIWGSKKKAAARVEELKAINKVNMKATGRKFGPPAYIRYSEREVQK